MSRTNKPIWQDTIVSETGVSLQHLVNGTWQDTGMRVMPVPAGYEPEAAINRFVEGDLKSTKPEFVGETAITVQPYAYQVYKTGDDEIGFINDWSYEEWTGDTKCLSAPINRHADSRQRLVYGNFSETGNSIIIKELIRPIITIEPREIVLNADGRSAAVTITSNKEYTLSAEGSWFTLSVDSGEPGTQVIYIGIDENKTFYDREAVITMTYESYWDLGYDTITAFTITQKAVVPSYLVTPMEQNVNWDFTGLTYFFVNTNVPYTASTNASWLSYSGTSQAGYHAYNVYYDTSANTGDDRQATVSFTFTVDATGGTQTITPVVRQVHAPNISIEPQSKEITSVAQGIRVQVSSETPWVSSTSYNWLSAPSSGISGVTLIFVDATANTGITQRNGSVIFSNGPRQATFTVNQDKPDDATKIIRYVSTDNEIVEPDQYATFGANIVSNTYYPDRGYGEIKFDGSVVKIGYEAFMYADNLESIIIPDSTTLIESNAFLDCGNLLSVILGSGITTIDTQAFQYCVNLSSITIPDSVRNIGYYAFGNCESLPSIIIPDSVTGIGDYAFYSCTNLSSVTLSSGVTTIGEGTFRACSNLLGVANCDNVTNIGDYAFLGCSSLSSITISSGVTSIGEAAFKDCSSLSTIIIPDGVTTINYRAFDGCTGLTSLTIGSGVTTIGEEAFQSCSSLGTIIIPDNVTSIGTESFRWCSSLSSLTIGSGVTVIGDSAFYGCNSLSSVTIPDTVVSIEESAFNACLGLASITIGSGVTSIGNSAFYICRALTSITIPDNVTSLGTSAFQGCTNLITATIGSGITSIPYRGFESCVYLSSITLDVSIISIGSQAFKSCMSLKHIYYNGTTTQWGAIAKGSNWKQDVSSTCIVHCTNGNIPI